jgi:uncharacterized membrane protein
MHSIFLTWENMGQFILSSLLYGLLIGVGMILGALCLGVGLVWAIPTVEIAWSTVFLELSGQRPNRHGWNTGRGLVGPSLCRVPHMS